MLNGVLVLAAVAAVAALVVGQLWRRAEARALALSEALGALETERDGLAASLSKESQARKRQAEELALHRKKADKAKKRQTRSTDQPLGTASRMRDLEDRLERAETSKRGLESERQALVDKIGTLEARLEVTARQLEQARAPVESVAPTPAAPAAEGAELEALRTQLEEQRERARKLEAEIQQARETEARMRKRMGNQEQLYASLRAELEVKKDRLRTQEEQLQRLQALKVAVAATD